VADVKADGSGADDEDSFYIECICISCYDVLDRGSYVGCHPLHQPGEKSQVFYVTKDGRRVDTDNLSSISKGEEPDNKQHNKLRRQRQADGVEHDFLITEIPVNRTKTAPAAALRKEVMSTDDSLTEFLANGGKVHRERNSPMKRTMASSFGNKIPVLM